jgi:hypothetical protein
MFAKSGFTPAVAIGVVAAGASIAALSACGTSSGGLAAGAGAASQTAASRTTVTTGTTVTTASVRIPECTARELRVAYTSNAQIREGALVGMSKTDNVVTFTNVGRTTCVIQGYPGVAALNAHGRQIAQAARSGGAVRAVFLRPGATASALVSANTASCNKPTSVPGLLVTAPDQYSSTHLGEFGDLCLASLKVGPVAPGNTGGLQL